MPTTDQRLYGMMQFLIGQVAAGDEPPPATPRNVVELRDALDALFHVAAVIDEHTQSGAIPAHRGLHAGAMLMLVRDYIQPLPKGLAADGTGDDLVTPDLQEKVGVLRQVHAPDSPPSEWR